MAHLQQACFTFVHLQQEGGGEEAQHGLGSRAQHPEELPPPPPVFADSEHGRPFTARRAERLPPAGYATRPAVSGKTHARLAWALPCAGADAGYCGGQRPDQ
jgi:hypothetical protein